MTTVADIAEELNRELHFVGPKDAVLKALRIMGVHKQGAILIVDQGRLLGIFSEHDLLERVVLQERDPGQTQITEVMTNKVITVEPTVTAEQCLILMNETGVRHVPVLRRGEVVALLTVLDLVNAVLREKLQMIGQLEKYVSETWPL